MANANSQSSGKLTPHLDEESTKLLNLIVLQRIDPSIQQILITAAHVTFYDFNLNLNQWSRKDVEGSLFVVKRNGQPRFQFIVMNRRNTENLVEDLLEDFEYEVQHPYLLYRNAAQEVNGIWFYNPQECDEVAHLFRRILGAYAKSPPKLQVTPSKSEYEELEVAQTSAVIEGPVEPSYSSSAARDLPEDSSFVNFFSSAMNIGNNASSNGISGQIYQASASAVPISSNPPSVVQSQTPMLKAPTLPMSIPSAPSFYRHDTSETIPSNRAELVKPSSFFVPTYSPTTLAPPISLTANASSHPPLDMQRSFAPLLQPFPPPTPPPSLTPNPAPAPAPIYIPLTRQNVREALITLVQDDQFIDMVTQALQKVHQP